jgi:hypothetical protein
MYIAANKRGDRHRVHVARSLRADKRNGVRASRLCQNQVSFEILSGFQPSTSASTVENQSHR